MRVPLTHITQLSVGNLPDLLYVMGEALAATDVQVRPLRAVWGRGEYVRCVEDLALHVVRSHDDPAGLVGQLLQARLRDLIEQGSVRNHGPPADLFLDDFF